MSLHCPHGENADRAFGSDCTCSGSPLSCYPRKFEINRTDGLRSRQENLRQCVRLFYLIQVYAMDETKNLKTRPRFPFDALTQSIQ